MTVEAPYDRRAIQDAFIDWIAAAVDLSCIWTRQNGPQPALPYLTLELGNFRSIGQDETSIDGEPEAPIVEGAEVELLSRGLRYFVLSINAYAKTHGTEDVDDAQMILDKVRASLGMDTYLVPLRAAGIAISSIGLIQNLDFVLADKFRSRAQMDVTVCVASNAVERVGYIEKVQINSEVLGWELEEFQVSEE